MSTLRLETYKMPAADLGPENPLAPLRQYGNLSSIADAAGYQAPADAPNYPDKGSENFILPYRIQSGYNRTRTPRDFKVAVLENDHLRATFLLELGGRLLSLFDKKAGRELLYVNPVFQPANLAIRSAWYTGGVEWNVGIFGHCVFTCEPVFAAQVKGDDGSPVLRIYDWERNRQVPFQIDFHLPDGSPFLYTHARIVNPHNYTIPMYWWSNIAVTETPGTRVLGPAEKAFRHSYDGKLLNVDVPMVEGLDVTYTTRGANAGDLYFAIPPDQRKWVAAIDEKGTGLIHASTDRLHGRKLFGWGTGPGGRRWQEFLAQPGEAYLEIQGGLAETQGKYVYMPPNSTWEWAEAYGRIDVDPATVHGDWPSAWRAADAKLNSILPRSVLDAFFHKSQPIAERAPEKVLHHGHGWAALERKRRSAADESAMAPAFSFPDAAMEPQQAPWLALLEKGELPRIDPLKDPGALMVQKEWWDLLESAVKAGRGVHWYSWYHLGVMRYRHGDRAGAKTAWEKSVAAEPSAWAYRNLAELAIYEKNDAAAADYLVKALKLAPEVLPLISECCESLLKAERPAEAAAIIDACPERIRSVGRTRMLRVRAGLALGDISHAESFYGEQASVDDLREGEVSVVDVWYQWQTIVRSRALGVPIDKAFRKQVRKELFPPFGYEFRMHMYPEPD